MWILICFLLVQSRDVLCHLPSYASTPDNLVEQYCLMAESCVHDTVPICGEMRDEKRTFLDLCDLLEYACDTKKMFNHIDDTEGCPVFKDSKLGK